MRSPAQTLTLGLVLLVCSATPALAHGIFGHVHVTGWAVENLPSGPLADFFEEPEVMNAALFGAAFTDSGYWPRNNDIRDAARSYAEHTHWEPFVQDFIVWIRENDPPPWTDLESRKRVGFLMGCAAHGMQDELFDSLFLYQIEEHDGAGQDAADPGTDGHVRFIPETYVPLDALLEVYATLDQNVTEDVIDRSVTTMMDVYMNDNFGFAIAEGMNDQYRDVIPWAAEHYLDDSIPGSLRSEVKPTLEYLTAVWQRLHGTWSVDDAVIATYPNLPRRLLGADSSSPDSWVTLVFGAQLDPGTLGPTWVDDAGIPVAFQQQGTRSGARFRAPSSASSFRSSASKTARTATRSSSRSRTSTARLIPSTLRSSKRSKRSKRSKQPRRSRRSRWGPTPL